MVYRRSLLSPVFYPRQPNTRRLPDLLRRSHRPPLRDRFIEYFQMSRMCGSTLLPNNSSASVSTSGSSEPRVWNDRSTTPQPIFSRASIQCPTISSGPPQN
jgi:hypothetical protein